MTKTAVMIAVLAAVMGGTTAQAAAQSMAGHWSVEIGDWVSDGAVQMQMRGADISTLDIELIGDSALAILRMHFAGSQARSDTLRGTISAGKLKASSTRVLRRNTVDDEGGSSPSGETTSTIQLELTLGEGVLSGTLRMAIPSADASVYAPVSGRRAPAPGGSAPSPGGSTPAPTGRPDAAAPAAAPAQVTYVTDRYEIVAPDEAALREARADVDFAVAQWRRYFGVEPARIAVVVLDNPAGIVAAGTAGYRERGLLVLPWITSAAMAAQRSSRGAAEGSAGNAELRALSHEVCHEFLRAYVQEKRGGGVTDDWEARRAGMSHYGHPAVADWFDEAVATLCEAPQLQERRLQHIRQRVGEAIAFPQLFTMEHPLSAAAASRLTSQDIAAAAAQVADPRGGFIVARSASSSSLPPEVVERALIFYSQVLSVAGYLAETMGERFIAQVADAYARGGSIEELLAGASALPDDPALLEDAWKRWLQRPCC